MQLLALSRTLGQTTGVPLLGALFASLALSREALAVHSNITITTASAEALVYGVQGTLHFAAFILGAATLLTAVIWRIERSLK